MHIVFIRNKLHVRSLLTYLHENTTSISKTHKSYLLVTFLLLFTTLIASSKKSKIIVTSDNSLSYSSYKTNLANSLKQTCVSFFMLAVIWYFYVMLPF